MQPPWLTLKGSSSSSSESYFSKIETIGLYLSLSITIGGSISSLFSTAADLESSEENLASLNTFCLIHESHEEHENQQCLNVLSWNKKGEIEFDDVFLFDSQEEEGVGPFSMKIDQGEKVGIVCKISSGRLIFKSLLGLLEIENFKGKINIDGVDIRSISKSAILDSFVLLEGNTPLLKGSIRRNLDPFCLKTDEEIRDFIKKTSLSVIENLEAEISEQKKGKFSLQFPTRAERTSILLARIILQKPTILLIDFDQFSDAEEKLVVSCIMTHLTTTTVVGISRTMRSFDQFEKVYELQGNSLIPKSLSQ